MPHNHPPVAHYDRGSQHPRRPCPQCGKTMDARARVCQSCFEGNRHPLWKGGRIHVSGGYIKIRCFTHPHADAKGYVMEHRLVMEAHVGRPLLDSEIVHHINGIPDDNRVENLALFDSHSSHIRHHRQEKRDARP